MNDELYLGVDGGQSHTEAVIANAEGHILARGRGGPSNHAEQPGGRERLARAVSDSVGGALRTIGSDLAESYSAENYSVSDTAFAAAHCAMTGGAEFKEQIIKDVLRSARLLSVGHDAGAALIGATGGKPGVVVIGGTGSVSYGRNSRGETWQAGGWGYLIGDEGSGYWIAKEAVRSATLDHDGLDEATVLLRVVPKHFGCSNLQAVDSLIYRYQIPRDKFASLTIEVHHAALEGDRVANRIIKGAGEHLARLAVGVARKLELPANETIVACVGGVFRAQLVRAAFHKALAEALPLAQVTAPRFGPAVGALLLAYQNAGRELSEELLMNLEREFIH